MINLWAAFILAIFIQNLISTTNNSSILLTIDNIPHDKGVIRVLLFNDEDGFPDQPEKAFQSASLEINNKRAVATFEDLPNGIFAISVFHDSENTGKLRTNVFGIPKDGYGFSNNVVGTFGPPSFRKAAIQVDNDVMVNINLR